MPTFSDLNTVNDALIRKGLEGLVAVKRWASGDPAVTALKDATGLLALPSGYTAIGRITKSDGVSWTRDVSTSDVESLGAAEPTRRDITSDVSGLNFTAQESRLKVFELYDGVDLTGKTYDANGNVSYDKPARPASIYYRALVLFKDGDGADAVYFAKWLPRAQVTDRGEQTWSEGSEVQYPLTFNAFVDKAVGTSVRTLWAGPTTTMSDMGFTAAV